MKSTAIVPVILAGGKGTRLWPLSRETYPKPLLKLLGEHSLLQNTIQLAQQINPTHFLVVANAQHQFLIKNQVAELQLTAKMDMLLEPISRNTAASVALASSYYLHHFGDALFVVLSADHVIKNPEKFVATVLQVAESIEAHEIVCFGVEPDRPHTGYGYIRAQYQDQQMLSSISTFIEKPNIDKATELFAQEHVYWNCGIFMFHAAAIKAEFQVLKPNIWRHCEQAIARAQYKNNTITIPLDDLVSCEDISFDYAIMEQTQYGKLAIMPCKWSDIGSWYSLWEEGNKDENNNVLVGNNIITRDVKNSYIQSNQRCIAVVGIEDQIIIETPDAILVAHKNNAQEVKQLVSMLNESEQNKSLTVTHKLVHRPWGLFESINQGIGYQVKRLLINPGQSISLQLHHHRSEHWVVVQGWGRIIKGDQSFDIHIGESTFIPKETKHKMTNLGDHVLEIIETQIGDYLGEDDIVRFEDKYGRATMKAVGKSIAES